MNTEHDVVVRLDHPLISHLNIHKVNKKKTTMNYMQCVQHKHTPCLEWSLNDTDAVHIKWNDRRDKTQRDADG